MGPDDFMRRALALARRGRGRVEPNPMVGAVLVRNGQVVAEGYHRRYGGPHAEVDVLNRCTRLGIDPRRCDLYVTLEPCNDQGKTPPCTDAILRARIRRVFVAVIDPRSAVNGRGVAKLRRAGVQVSVGLCREEALELIRPYAKRTAMGLPWVTGKWAQSLDGKIATGTGDSKWISGEGSRRAVHRMRAGADAVVVGIGTALADDPLLTARGVGVRRVARRVVIDPRARLPVESKLVRSLADGGPPVVLAVRRELAQQRPPRVRRLEKMGVELIGLPPVRRGRDKGLSLKPLLSHMCREHGATNVLVEGGARLFGSLLAQGLVDELVCFVCPIVIGAANAVPALTGLTCNMITDASRITLYSSRRIGGDVMLSYRVARENNG